MPYFSIVMQSTLKDYPGAASNRPQKLVRAIESVINQTFQDWELVFYADNCYKSFEIAWLFLDKTKYDTRFQIGISDKTFDKWNSYCRNLGKETAKGKYCLYLDNDDYYSADYLQNLFNAIQNNSATWYIADHYEWKNNAWQMIRANLVPNSAGTANIIHSSQILSRWPDSGTRGMEDWQFIKRLMNESKDYKHLDLAGYYIGHITGRYDI